MKKCPPHLDAVFFCNSGTEANEGAIKFARAATGRSKIISLHGSYHGLSYGSLSVTDSGNFREGFGDMLEGVSHVEIGDLTGLENALAFGDVAAFIIEPVQGKGVHFPTDDFYQQAQALCRQARHDVHLRRGPDRARPHGQMVGARALGPRAGHHDPREIAQRRLRALRRDCHAAEHLPKGLQQPRSLRGAQHDLRAQQPRHDLRAGHAQRARGRKARRERGAGAAIS